MRCSPRRSSSAAISSAWRSSAARCRRAARSPRTTASRARTARPASPDLFGDKQTLVVYSYMFGPQRKRPCPMCTSLMSCLGRRGARHRAARRARDGRALADRAAGRVQAGARLEPPEALFRRRRRLHPRLCERRGRGRPGIQRLHPPRRHDPPFLERRDGRRDRRSRPGPARRARPRCRSGPSSTPRPRAAARTGIRSWNIRAEAFCRPLGGEEVSNAARAAPSRRDPVGTYVQRAGRQGRLRFISVSVGTRFYRGAPRPSRHPPVALPRSARDRLAQHCRWGSIFLPIFRLQPGSHPPRGPASEAA